MINILFNDNAMSKEIRENNIKVFLENNFVESGLPSQAGQVRLKVLKNKYQLIFGIRGSQRRRTYIQYFSLVKEYELSEEALEDFRKIKKKLQIET